MFKKFERENNVLQIVNGKWKQNCYVVHCGNNYCILIDPGSSSQHIIREIKLRAFKPLAIFLTHGHFDHIGAAETLRVYFDIPVYAHVLEKNVISQATSFAIVFGGPKSFQTPEISHYFCDNEEFFFEKLKLQIFHTPGHTIGSSMFHLGGKIFSGDILFSSGLGEAKPPHGDEKAMRETSIKIPSICAEKMVFPGHGRPFWFS